MNIDIDRLNQFQKQELMRHIQDMEMRSSVSLLSTMTDFCIDKCVLTSWGGGFSSKNLSDAESKCVSSCAEKFFKVNQRTGFRFAEFQANQNLANQK